MTEELPDANRAGCLMTGILFAATVVLAWLAVMAIYVVLVEITETIAVPREFGLDFGFLYAPLMALLAGTGAAIWASRGGAGSRLKPVTVCIALAALLAFLFFGLRMFY